jgi:hypothetical protein
MSKLSRYSNRALVGILFPLVLYFSGPLDWDGEVLVIKPCDEARISKADLPEPNVMAVGHEPEWQKVAS